MRICSAITSCLKTFAALALLLGAARAQTATQSPAAPVPAPAADPAPAAAKPTIYIAGDSTANSGGKILGWGTPFATFFDPAKVTVVNSAAGGRSSRTFISDGSWNKIFSKLKAGDYVLIQFGHNDIGGINEEPPGSKLPLRARGTIPGLGEESAEIDNVVTKKHETVHTFGWYLRSYVADVRSKGAIPVILTLTVRNEWADGKIERGPGHYSEWSAAVAKDQHVRLVDLTAMMAEKYEKLGRDQLAPFYSTTDTTHSSPAGAALNAEAIVSGLKALKNSPFTALLSEKGRAVPAAGSSFFADNLPPPAK